MADFYSDGQLPDKEFYRQPKYPVVIEALKVFLMVFAVEAAIIYAAFDLAKSSYDFMWFAAGFMLMPWISTAVRRCVGNIFVYIIVHALMGAWIFLSPHLVLTTLGIIYWLILTVYGIVRQMAKESERELSFATLLMTMGTIACIYILAVDRGTLAVTPVLLSIAILYGILFLYYQHWIGVHDALKGIDKEGNFSLRRIIQFNNKMFLAYLGIAIAVCGILYVAGMNDVINWATSMMVGVVRHFSNILASIDGSEGYLGEEESSAPEGDGEGNAGLSSLLAEPPESSPIWLALEFILEIVFFAAVIAFIAYVCYSLFKRFSNVRHYQELGYEETKVFYKSVPKEKKPKHHRLKDLFDNSPENKIRRAYYKKVRGQMGKKVQPYDTPIEVAETLPEVREIVDAYDQARYAKDDLKE